VSRASPGLVRPHVYSAPLEASIKDFLDIEVFFYAGDIV
jgi:hypothetical protein